MRYVTFSTTDDAAPRLGVLDGKEIVDVRSLAPASADHLPGTLLELVQEGRPAWERLAARIQGERSTRRASRHLLTEVRCHAPIPRPAKNIVCLGLNYASHAKESAEARGRRVTIPESPVFFTKAPTSVNGPYDDIPWDRSVTQQVDWEVELGLLIGVGGRNIPRGDSLRHVFGYTIINEVSARDLQKRHYQWFKGKSLDGFCPMGPWVVTPDEFGDPHTKQVLLRVNGVVKQNANTAAMIFPIDVIIASLSEGMTIEAGDVIATGTPEGVGMGRTPPEFLQDGDVVEAEIEGIGTLRNRVKALR